MPEKLSHDEVSARGGRSRSLKKTAAVMRNLDLAQKALNAKRTAKKLLSAAGERSGARTPP